MNDRPAPAVAKTPGAATFAANAGEAAVRWVGLARDGEAALLMKGDLHIEDLLITVVAASRLRKARRISHVYVVNVLGTPRPLLTTDAAINVTPSLAEGDIVCNAIDPAHATRIAAPLAAVDMVTPRMPSTTDAAALCTMGGSGQISSRASRTRGEPAR